MKRIIAFVLFALIIYAGGFFVVYGIDELGKANSLPVSLTEVGSDTLHNGEMVAGTVYQQVKRIGTETVRQEFLGIEFGKPLERRYYLVPLKYEKKAGDLRYYVVCVSGEESIAQMETLLVDMPKPESGGGLELKGVAQQMTPAIKSRVFNILSTRSQLVDDRIVASPVADYYYNRIIPWTVFERTNFDSALVTLIIGIVLVLGGAIPAVILGIKVYRERY